MLRQGDAVRGAVLERPVREADGRGIGGGRPLGYGPHRVRSLPDAIAQVLAEDIGMTNGNGHGTTATEVEEVQSLAAPPGGGTLSLGDLCPECGHASLVYQEGCRKCFGCGFSEC